MIQPQLSQHRPSSIVVVQGPTAPVLCHRYGGDAVYTCVDGVGWGGGGLPATGLVVELVK